ncbi:hypothetical protein ACH5RR_041127 [Cinchona calisaya]|uniref:non-specific serine/threonine protein kinase n=1 Tax=Cinchona calisaya TaxID=153742 RepID=A0ABD2XW17_9GENT
MRLLYKNHMVQFSTTSAAPSSEALMKPNTAIPDEPFSLGTSSLSVNEEPPSPSVDVESFVPSTLPQNAYGPHSFQGTPPPPPTGFVSPPPSIWVLKRIKYRHYKDCHSSPSRGLNGALDSFYTKVPDKLNQKIPAIGVHVIPASGEIFSPPPTNSNDGSPSSIFSDSESHFSPQGHVAGFSFSGGNFTYTELVRATNGFTPANLLGQGGFGYVHKGVLPTGREIAVKQLKKRSQQGEREFQVEIETISRVHHKHLVSLVGYCITGSERLLVYVFVHNGTLEFHLHGEQQPVMDWATRMKIAIGSAKGLAFRHEDCHPTIIHRDIKAGNILLDSNYEPKVSDFGLAKVFCVSNHHITHVSTRVVGTFGYLAPEYAQSGKASDKSDVYSFGIMLLELITGCESIIERETMNLASWARPYLRKALENRNYATLVDPRLQGNYNDQEMANMVSCTAACVHRASWRRPRMSQIVPALEGDAPLMDLDEGITPGQASHFFYYHTGGFTMSKFRLMFAGGQNGVGGSTDKASIYNLHLSGPNMNIGEKFYLKVRGDNEGKQKGKFSI